MNFLDSELPISSALSGIVDNLRKNQVTIIAAPPGSGKTTGVPPALLNMLDGRNKVYLLQPRRMAARTVAARLAQLLDCSVGGLVGYQVRMDKRLSSESRIVVMTYGVLLRKLQNDPLLDDAAVVLLDEFHERSLEADLTLGMLTRIQTIREDLKIGLMSATLDVDPIAKFLNEAPVISVSGRAYPLQIHYQDRINNQRLDEQVSNILPEALRATQGHVLVFLPGVGEIRKTARRISALPISRDLAIMELYGDMTPERQDAVLQDAQKRKVILSTNVAETSITIPGVDCVIDSGQARIMRMNPAVGLPRLDLEPISMASAAQRAGRAGRTCPGKCFRLWMKAFDRARPEFDTPEILRGDLASAVLQLYGWGEDDIAAFPWLTPPTQDAIQSAEMLLRRLQAIDSNQITDLGKEMLRIPAHPRIARMLLEAQRRGVARQASICAAMLTERDPFIDNSSGARISKDHAKLLGLDTADLVARTQRLLSYLDGENDAAIQRNSALGVKRAADHYLLSLDESITDAPTDIPDSDVADKSGEELAKCLLAAFPDRLAKLRQPSSDKGLMVGGQGVRLRTATHSEATLFLCIDLLQKTSDAEVRLSTPINEEWLEDDQISIADECFFHPSQKRVVARRRRYWLDLILSEQPVEVSDDAAAAEILFSEVRARWDRVFPTKDAALQQLLGKVAKYAELSGNNATTIDRAWLEQVAFDLCQGKRSLDDVQNGPWLDVVKSRLGYDFLFQLQDFLPNEISVPSGNQVKIEYGEGAQPSISVRLQEMFGWQDTPRICGGRVPLLLKILAPNYREIQVTSDLASFWRSGYFEVRKELRRRYPKHHWPEDPLTAKATKSGLGRHAKNPDS